MSYFEGDFGQGVLEALRIAKKHLIKRSDMHCRLIG
jgi:hypothetical protein